MTLLGQVHRVELMSWVNTIRTHYVLGLYPCKVRLSGESLWNFRENSLGCKREKKNFRLGRETFSYQCTRGISAFSTVFHPKLQSRHDYIQFTTFSLSLAYTLALSSQLLRNLQRFLLCCFTWQNNIILPKSFYQPRSGMAEVFDTTFYQPRSG